MRDRGDKKCLWKVIKVANSKHIKFVRKWNLFTRKFLQWLLYTHTLFSPSNQRLLAAFWWITSSTAASCVANKKNKQSELFLFSLLTYNLWLGKERSSHHRYVRVISSLSLHLWSPSYFIYAMRPFCSHFILPHTESFMCCRQQQETQHSSSDINS